MATMTVAMLILPGIDAIAKWLAGSVPAGQIAWARFAVQIAIMAPFALRSHRLFDTRRLGQHALRGALIALTTLIFFVALRYLPLAEAIAIFFVEPLLLTLWGALFLGERVGWRRAVAVVAGLAGTAIVIRPGFTHFGLPALLPLGAALTFSIYLLITRRLAVRENPALMQFYAGLFGLAVMSMALAAGEVADIEILNPVWPSSGEWALLGLLGVIATAGHYLVVLAFKRAEASLLAPFQYLEILGATLYGLVLFNDLPDAVSWLGIAIIVSSGVYIAHRERIAARA